MREKNRVDKVLDEKKTEFRYIVYNIKYNTTHASIHTEKHANVAILIVHERIDLENKTDFT